MAFLSLHTSSIILLYAFSGVPKSDSALFSTTCDEYVCLGASEWQIVKNFIAAARPGFTIDVAMCTIVKFKENMFCGDVYELDRGEREGGASQEGRGVVVGVV